MKRQYRLKKKQEFQDVIKNGKKIATDLFVIYYKEYDEINNSEVGISVSKKIEKLAVNRNKIKRQIKSFLKKYDYSKKYKIVIIVRKKYTYKNIKEIELLKESLLKTINKIN